jgi:hypothetical protein
MLKSAEKEMDEIPSTFRSRREHTYISSTLSVLYSINTTVSHASVGGASRAAILFIT